MTTLQNAAKVIVLDCLKLKKTESCLIIFDINKKQIAEVIFKAAKNVSKNVIKFEIPVGKISGEEPSKEVSEMMKKFDVIICPTTKSLTHTNARINATKKGARIATLPGITEDMMKRCIDIDYKEMDVLSDKLADALSKTKLIHIFSKIGTDMKINVEKAKIHGRHGGDLSKKGAYGNLPEGEIFFAPIQKNTLGIYVVDASHAGVGKLKNPIKITAKDGYAISIEGEKEADILKKMLKSIKNKNAFNIAEFGIGVNKKAKITGVVLEDEKVYGTCHIALGKNDSFGGKINVPIHVDGVIKNPTIYFDEKIIMKNGKMMI